MTVLNSNSKSGAYNVILLAFKLENYLGHIDPRVAIKKN